MTGRGYPHQDGGLARALEVVGERWTLLIIREAMGGVSRFDDFHAALGLSPCHHASPCSSIAA